MVLLNTAIALFAEHGYDEVTIRAIGRRLGMTSASLYRHYESKAALLADAFELVIEALIHGLLHIISRPGSAEDRLVGAVSFHADFAMRHRTYLRVYYLEIHHLGPTDRVIHRRRASDYRSLWVQLLIEANVVRGRDEAEHVYAMAMAMINVGSTSRIHDVDSALLVDRTLRMVMGTPTHG